MGFKYEERTQEDVSRRSKQSSGAYDNYLRLGQFKPHTGENCIRIVPWLNGERKDAKEQREKWGGAKTSGYHWGIDILVHFKVGPEESAFLCLKMKGLPCPVCEARQSASDDDERSDLQAVNRVLCWVVDRDEPKAGVQPWAMPLKLSKDISKRAILKGEGGWLAIDHPDKGYDVFFDKEGEKIKTRYERAEVNRDPSPLSKDSAQAEGWLAYVDENFLPELLNYYEYDYIEQVLFGGSSRSLWQPSEWARQTEDRPRRNGPEAPREREETVARGRRGEPAETDRADERPQRGDREETVSRRSRDGDGSAPWEGRDKAAETAQESREAATAKDTPRFQADKPKDEAERPRREPEEPDWRAREPDDDRSSEAARERLSKFRERRRG